MPTVVSNTIMRGLASQGIPGAGVAIVRDRRVIFEKGYGFRNVAARLPVDVNTRFEIGSVTKQFTAAAILQLEESGKLSLDERLGKYIPQYAAARDITIRQLLWQTSGIPNFMDFDKFEHLSTTHQGSFDAVLALVKNEPLQFRAGTRWRYSNTNYSLLARVVEIASRIPWQRYVREHIFEPAGMTHSTFDDREGQVADMAAGYFADALGKVTMSPSMGLWARGNGDIVSTAGDLARWDDAFFGGRIVSPAHVLLATTPGRLRDGSATGYGFGWGIDQHDGQRRISHNGRTNGFTAMNASFPELHERIIVLVNNADGDAQTLADHVFAALHPDLAASENVPAVGEDSRMTARIVDLAHHLRNGNPDRSQWTPTLRRFLTPQVLHTGRALFVKRHPNSGQLLRWVYRGKRALPGGATFYMYNQLYESGLTMRVFVTVARDGKFDQYFSIPG